MSDMIFRKKKINVISTQRFHHGNNKKIHPTCRDFIQARVSLIELCMQMQIKGLHPIKHGQYRLLDICLDLFFFKYEHKFRLIIFWKSLSFNILFKNNLTDYSTDSPSQSATTILVLKTWVGLWPWKKSGSLASSLFE